MESGDLNHVGSEYVVVNLMLHSASPHGRRLAEELYTGDPYNIDIKLDSAATNRNVEIANAYLKTMGLRLKFTKRRKKLTDVVKIKPVKFRYAEQDIKMRDVMYMRDMEHEQPRPDIIKSVIEMGERKDVVQITPVKFRYVNPEGVKDSTPSKARNNFNDEESDGVSSDALNILENIADF